MIAGWDELCDSLASSVGGYLTNTRRGHGYCAVCTAPVAGFDDCYRCGHPPAPRSELCDRVVPIAYGGHSQQSRTLLREYKAAFRITPGFEPFRNREEQILFALLVVGAILHRPCLDHQVRPMSVVTAVPSTRLGGQAPLVGLVDIVAQLMGLPRLTVGYSGPVGDAARDYLPDNYQPESSGALRGAHVLVIDDTWVSGARAESTATALKRGGAQRVTALTAGRWLKRGSPPSDYYFDHAEALPPFNPRTCPVTGGECPS